MYYCISVSLTLDIFNYFNINAYYFIFQKKKLLKTEEIICIFLYIYALNTPKMNVFSMTKKSTLNNNKLKKKIYIYIYF